MSTETFETTAERTIGVPAARAFEAWADSAQVSVWFTTTAKQDFRVGGRYDNGDGDQGEYLAIVPNEHIRFTWENPGHYPGTMIDVRFLPRTEDSVTVRITHSELPSPDAIPGFTEGWSWALDSLASYLETGEGIGYAAWQERKKLGV